MVWGADLSGFPKSTLAWPYMPMADLINAGNCDYPALSAAVLMQAVDISGRTVTFGQNGSSMKVDYDLLIGADGVNSRVR